MEKNLWAGLSTGAYCFFDNDIINRAIYGVLYNWFATVDSRNIAPEGWHVPTDDEWKELEMYLGMSQSEVDGTGYRGTDEGKKLKSSIAWNGIDEVAFSGLPGGYCNHNGYFYYMGHAVYFWSVSVHPTYGAWNRGLHNDNDAIGRIDNFRQNGFSIRCVQD